MNNKLLINILLGFTLVACGPKALTEKELAQKQLKIADSCFANNQLDAAKLHIDTINNLYEKQIAIRKVADSLFTQIKLVEAKRNLIYADSVIKFKQAEFDKLAKDFRYEKNEKYEDSGKYIYKWQRTENIAGSSFIKPLVEETGLFTLTSVLCSDYAINHQSAKFIVGDVFAETEIVPLESAYNHRYKDSDKYFETVVYRNSSNEGIAQLLQDNTDKTIKVVLQGETKKNTIWLSKTEKDAITKAYNFSIVLKDLKDLERIISTSKKKIILYETELEQQ